MHQRVKIILMKTETKTKMISKVKLTENDHKTTFYDSTDVIIWLSS